MSNGLELFGLDVAGLVYDALKGQLRPGVLSRDASGARDPNNLAAGRAKAAPVTYEFEGAKMQELVTEKVSWDLRNVVADGLHRVIILSRSVDTVPVLGDVLELDGETFVVEKVDTDPARATFTCTVRD